MFNVVKEQTGPAYKSRVVDKSKILAGKTGTSQIREISEEERLAGIKKNEDLPMSQRDHALFAGYAPFVNPKYAISVVVEHGGGGSKVAAPIARDVLLFALSGAIPALNAYPIDQRNEVRLTLDKIREKFALKKTKRG